jgi:hypothetical protein
VTDSPREHRSPIAALRQLVVDESDRLRSAEASLATLRELLPALEAEQHARQPLGELLQVETVSFEAAPAALRALAADSTGDLRWIRPGGWRQPAVQLVDQLVQDLLREGRRSLVLYPARAMEEAPERVRRRAEWGEHVRLLPEVPGRVAVVGTTAAMLPRDFDEVGGPMIIVRQPAFVTVASLLFDSLWERALVVPGIGGGVPEPASVRRLLLDQLARGSKDEQIARTLGLSLRTVRRRVAELMDELGTTSRFQAGVEAIRRGWL